MDVRLFLSYAEEDAHDGRDLAAYLSGLDNEVFSWQDQRGGRFVERIEEEINRADAFVAVLSPSFLASPWCRLERELAIHRDMDRWGSGGEAGFIHVVEIAATPYPDAGFLRSYDWIRVTSVAGSGDRYSELAERLGLSREAGSATRGTAPAVPSPTLLPPTPLFRNRRDELKRIVDSLTTVGGEHFWLVIAPPELGKTWFLGRMSAEVTRLQPDQWISRFVDVREQPPETRDDVGTLLAVLFGTSSPVSTSPESLVSIAEAVCEKGKSLLCLLDSAEMLAEDTAAELRSCLGKIHGYVQSSGDADIRVALVVASRRDDEWMGVVPEPRLSSLPLTEFKDKVVQQALRDLAAQMNRSFSDQQFQYWTRLVHRLSEGLPVLLVRCLQWIRRESYWVHMERLERQDLFERFAEPYIREKLLSQASLIPSGDGELDELHQALEQAFRILAPYRLFTQAHLRYHLESDPVFQRVVANAGLSVVDLWRAISATALLRRPLDEPWQEIPTPIRRLLYRYYYKSDDQRAEAHKEAQRFVRLWADKQTGTEQGVGLVECLWHEACVLRLTESEETAQMLSESASKLSEALRPSAAYEVGELRTYAARRLRNDEEFQERVDHIAGMANHLIRVIMDPQQES